MNPLFLLALRLFLSRMTTGPMGAIDQIEFWLRQYPSYFTDIVLPFGTFSANWNDLMWNPVTFSISAAIVLMMILDIVTFTAVDIARLLPMTDRILTFVRSIENKVTAIGTLLGEIDTYLKSWLTTIMGDLSVLLDFSRRMEDSIRRLPFDVSVFLGLILNDLRRFLVIINHRLDFLILVLEFNFRDLKNIIFFFLRQEFTSLRAYIDTQVNLIGTIIQAESTLSRSLIVGAREVDLSTITELITERANFLLTEMTAVFNRVIGDFESNILDQFLELKGLIGHYTDELMVFITRSCKDIVDILLSSIGDAIKTIEDFMTPLFQEILDKIATVKRTIDELFADLKAVNLRTRSLMQDGFRDAHNERRNEKIVQNIHRIAVEGGLWAHGGLLAGIVAVTGSTEALIIGQNISMPAAFGGIALAISGVEATAGFIFNSVEAVYAIVCRTEVSVRDLSSSVQDLLNELRLKFSELATSIEDIVDLIREIKNLLTNIEQVIQKAVEKEIKNSLPILQVGISNSIVGESYYKWAGTNTFQPTIVLIFKENTTGFGARRAQIKIRINTRSEDFTDSMVDDLKLRFRALEGFGWTYGSIRGTYVSGDKNFKTTVFGASKSTIQAIIEAVCSAGGASYDPLNLSFTEDRNRPIMNKRVTALGGVEPLTIDYSTDFPVVLYKVSLLVCGLEAPIAIYNAPD